MGSRYRNEFSPFSQWKPSIHMPHWASRILLEIVSVRVERLQDISEDDAKAEGFDGWKCATGHGDFYETLPSAEFRDLWTNINGPESWDANSWVWVVEFRRTQLPVKE